MNGGIKMAELNFTKQHVINIRDENNQYAEGGSGETWALAKDWLALQSELDTLKQSVKDAVEEIQKQADDYGFYDEGAGLQGAIDILRSHGLIGKE